MMNRRFLLGGVAALAAGSLAGCGSAPPGKFRRYDGPPVTSILVRKAPRQMYLLNGNQALKVYDIKLGSHPIGHKMMEGDGRTPEGIYRIATRNPNSSYHLSLQVSYPDVEDVARAEALGVNPGGNIFIHGTPPQMTKAADWTAGCIAVRNDEIEEVYAMVRDGTPIFILPA